VPTNLSQIEFARGDRKGSFTTSTSRTEDLIEADGELGVAVPEQELGLEGTVLKPPGQVPSLLGHPLAGRTGGDAGEMDLAAGDLDEEEDVETLEPGSLDREEVAGQHLGGVLADELPPGGMAAAVSRREALAAQDPGHLHVCDPKAELDHLPLNPAVAPSRVLLRQLQSQRPPLGVAHWALAPRPLAEGCPLAPDQIAMPAEQRLRLR
jgi:hypothetical protein